MAYFARELRYGLYDDALLGLSYILLAELVKKKGGRPVRFVLYRQTMQHAHAEMILINNVETAEEAVRRFWHSDAHGKPQTGNEFPNLESKLWVKTVPWLDLRSVFHPWTWVRVCIPRHRQRKKKPLQVGNLAHILLKHQTQLPELSRERRRAQLELDTITSYHDDDGDICIAEADAEEHAVLLGVIAEIDERIASAVAEIERTKEEMRYVIRKMFPKPMGLVPKRVLRYERERKAMGLS